jgi:PBSX family phage portal protein
MAERVAKFAGDDEIPTIEHVYTVSKQVVDNGEYADAFSKPAQFAKSLGGTTPNFKRKVTNELKKYNRSADGTVESKQITDEKEMTGYDAFGVVTPPHNLEGLAAVYEMSEAHYAAVNAKVDNIVGLGFKLIETSKTRRGLEALDGNEKKLKKVRATLDTHREELYEQIENMNDDDSFTEILVKFWRDYEVTGNGYLEIGRKRDGTIGYLGHIPAQTLRIRRKRDGFVQISANKAQFFRNFGDTKTVNPIGDDKPNEILHMKRYSPTNSYYGVPDVIAAQGAVAANEMITRFNLEFFENKAVPRHLITLKGANLGSNAQSELLTFFETGLKGQNHRSLFIPLPGDDGLNKVEFKIEAIDAKIQEASFDKYNKSNQAKILMAHRVPISKVNTAEGATLAIARDADKTFKEQVCGPQQKMLEKKLNRIVKELTDAFEFKLNEMTLTDENTQSQIYERYRKVGVMTGNEVRMAMGMPTIKGGDELVDLNAKDKLAATQAEATTTRQRDSVRSAAASDNAGEARQPKGDGRATP